MRLRASLLVLVLFSAGVRAEPVAAPAFALRDASGELVSLEDLRGKVVLVNFFASWCGPCRQELPILSAMHERYAKLGFTVLGIDVDNDRASADRLLETIRPSFPVVYDTAGDVARRYHINGMPNTAIIDRQGRLRFRHRGYTAGVELTYLDEVRRLLGER